MTTRLRNKVTGEVLSTTYPLAEAYYPWEIISDSRAEVALKRVLKAPLVEDAEQEITEKLQ